MKTMINRAAVLLAAAIGMGATGLYAQANMVANIPFDFTVKGKLMPAGQYHVTRDLKATDMIQISSVKDGSTALLVTYKALVTDPGSTAKLIFNQYGDRYFFSELWTSDGAHRRANPSKLEQEVKASASKSPTPITIAAEDF